MEPRAYNRFAIVPIYADSRPLGGSAERFIRWLQSAVMERIVDSKAPACRADAEGFLALRSWLATINAGFDLRRYSFQLFV